MGWEISGVGPVIISLQSWQSSKGRQTIGGWQSKIWQLIDISETDEKQDRTKKFL